MTLGIILHDHHGPQDFYAPTREGVISRLRKSFFAARGGTISNWIDVRRGIQGNTLEALNRLHAMSTQGGPSPVRVVIVRHPTQPAVERLLFVRGVYTIERQTFETFDDPYRAAVELFLAHCQLPGEHWFTGDTPATVTTFMDPMEYPNE